MTRVPPDTHHHHVPQLDLLLVPAQVPLGEDPGGRIAQYQEQDQDCDWFCEAGVQVQRQDGREEAQQLRHVRRHHRV